MTSTANLPISALALDIARSNVRLAALKIQAKMRPASEELKAAARLRNHYAHKLEWLVQNRDRSSEIAQVSPIDNLQKCLAVIASHVSQQEYRRIPVLKALVETLSNLSKNGTLSCQTASELWDSMRLMEK